MRLGLPEILLIAFVIVLFVNPKQLPGLFRKAGQLFQQMKGMRETFVRSMNEIDREIRVDATPASPGSVGGNGMETARFLLRTQPQPLPFERRVQKKLPTSAPTSIHLSMSTGLGDRVVFQGIIRHAILKGGPAARVVAAVYDSGPKYSVRSYRPMPHEIWTMQRPADAPGTEPHIAGAVKEAAAMFFADAGSLTVYNYAAAAPSSEAIPGVVVADLYAYYASIVAPEKIYPGFPVRPETLAAARARLRPSGSPPLVALHCRNRPEMQEKNPRRADMLALARELKRMSVALVLIPDPENADRELADLCDHTCGLDPSLQEPACVLSLCEVFIGGDSGPAHLAAAVGTPVVSLRPPRLPWVNGPFCEEARLAAVQGTIVEEDGHRALSFDVGAACASARAFLERRKTATSPDHANGPAQRRI